MAKDTWHVEVKGQLVKSTRHYGRLEPMYAFVLRNRLIFANKEITIFKNYSPFTDTNYKKIRSRMDNFISEKHERRLLHVHASMYGYNPTLDINQKNLKMLINIQKFPNIICNGIKYNPKNPPRYKKRQDNVYLIKKDYDTYMKKYNDVSKVTEILCKFYRYNLVELNEIIYYTIDNPLTPEELDVKS